MSTNHEYKIQGIGVYPIQMGLDNFRQIKDLNFYVITNEQISYIKMYSSLNTECIVQYQPRIRHYFPQLKEELESLCRMIMIEKDKNLTGEAIRVKKSLGKYFQTYI